MPACPASCREALPSRCAIPVEGSRWSKRELKRLRAMYDARASYTEMAEMLGRTRNAIAGKISRMREDERRKLYKQTGVHHKLPRKRHSPKPHASRFKPVRPAPHAHPLFRQLIALMNENQISRRELCKRVPCSEYTFDNYRSRAEPTLTILEAMYSVMGKKLVPVDIED